MGWRSGRNTESEKCRRYSVIRELWGPSRDLIEKLLGLPALLREAAMWSREEKHRSGFKSQPCHLLAESPWVGDSAFLGVKVPTSQGHLELNLLTYEEYPHSLLACSSILPCTSHRRSSALSQDRGACEQRAGKQFCFLKGGSVSL